MSVNVMCSSQSTDPSLFHIGSMRSENMQLENPNTNHILGFEIAAEYRHVIGGYPHGLGCSNFRCWSLRRGTLCPFFHSLNLTYETLLFGAIPKPSQFTLLVFHCLQCCHGCP